MNIEERIMLRLKKKPMTTDQIAKDMRTARSTVVAALNKMWNRRNICVVQYKKTGATPARIWGVGKVDMPRPPLQTKAQINERRRKLYKVKKERVAKPVKEVKPDIAAAWIKPVPKIAAPKPKPLKASKQKVVVVPKRDLAASWF